MILVVLDMAKKWYIQEGLYFEELLNDVFALNYSADNTSILLTPEEIDDVVDALKRIKAHYTTKEMIETEKEAMARWGKQKTPTNTNDIETTF